VFYEVNTLKRLNLQPEFSSPQDPNHVRGGIHEPIRKQIALLFVENGETDPNDFSSWVREGNANQQLLETVE
jgi:hypothetical protein